MSQPVYLYCYEASPFARKAMNILLLKGVEHQRIDVSRVPPRLALSELLGLDYRRIPVLAIGRDLYCDTSLIASVLERRFPSSAGYGSIFPERKGCSSKDTGLIKAFAMAYADRTLFPPATRMLPWDKLPEAFVADRSSMFGAPLNPKDIIAKQPTTASTLSSHLALAEEQLNDGREWLFDTASPSLADISLHFIYAWIAAFPASKDLFDHSKFPKLLAWRERLSAVLKAKNENVKYSAVSGEDAAQAIVAAQYDDALEFDDVNAKRLGLTKGAHVSVAPEDTGRNVPTNGKLVGLNDEEVVIEVKGSVGAVHVHFPRLHYIVRSSDKLSKL